MKRHAYTSILWLFYFLLMGMLPVIGGQQTIPVMVGQEGSFFAPHSVNAGINDTVQFIFSGPVHTVTQGSFDSPCLALPGGFSSGVSGTNVSGAMTLPPIWNLKITNNTEPIWFFCEITQPSSHCAAGMVGVINPPNQTAIDQYSDASKNIGTLPQNPPFSVVLTGVGAVATAPPTVPSSPPSTTASSSSSSSNTPTTPPSSGKSDVAAIAGGAAGGAVILVVLVVGTIWLCYRRNQARVRNLTPSKFVQGGDMAQYARYPASGGGGPGNGKYTGNNSRANIAMNERSPSVDSSGVGAKGSKTSAAGHMPEPYSPGIMSNPEDPLIPKKMGTPSAPLSPHHNIFDNSAGTVLGQAYLPSHQPHQHLHHALAVPPSSTFQTRFVGADRQGNNNDFQGTGNFGGGPGNGNGYFNDQHLSPVSQGPTMVPGVVGVGREKGRLGGAVGVPPPTQMPGSGIAPPVLAQPGTNTGTVDIHSLAQEVASVLLLHNSTSNGTLRTAATTTAMSGNNMYDLESNDGHSSHHSGDNRDTGMNKYGFANAPTSGGGGSGKRAVRPLPLPSVGEGTTTMHTPTPHGMMYVSNVNMDDSEGQDQPQASPPPKYRYMAGTSM